LIRSPFSEKRKTQEKHRRLEAGLDHAGDTTATTTTTTTEKKKKKKKDTTSSSVGVREGAAVESNSQIIQKGNNNGNGNNKNDDDKGSSGTPTPTKPDKPSTPRNPLARMKENSKPVVRASPPVIAGADTSLWSDDDEDQADQAAATATATAGASQDKRKIPVLEKRKKKRRPADTTNKARQDWSTSNVSVPNVKDVSGKDTAALQAELMPDFERPKFGPFALEPLKLLVPSDVSPDGSIEDEQGDDEDSKKKVVQVPASINRFLPNFQQEGIGFVYKVISSKRGAILGDDMGVGAFYWMAIPVVDDHWRRPSSPLLNSVHCTY
jgi:hypothetical protein